MISSRAFSLMRKPFFPTTCRSFGTFYGHENSNIIRSFKVAKPWRSNYMLQSMEIPKGGHRLSFFISYHVVSDDDEADQEPNWKRKQTKRPAESSFSKLFKHKKSRQTEAGSSDCCVKDGQKVKIHLKLYDIHTHEVRCETNPEHDPEIIGPGENDICEGLYEGIVGMRVGQIRRIVLPLSSDLTGEYNKMMMKKKRFEDHGIYHVKLVEIIG
ncbi:hypothetical protein POPTR_012G012100v4 [Populus trichocarpa]|uniref:Rotamase n=2 Tax=Populus trichocarpa TaxID=3694 RepID=A0A2K1Y750_POPTR|nr:uncharacterized protein LOC7489840 isoform X1 [Populus trichocarpa]PNT08853.1 hypothetical protein POPTR_012G012100v4 [Populus trichocarpa]|eukprot:XP_024437514.1 uncharacterized protein LOC18110685 [Populus trichocarpa]